MFHRRTLAAATAAACCLYALGSGAVEVYRWVDENGTTHFSDVLPERDTGVTTLHLPEGDPAPAPPDALPATLPPATESSANPDQGLHAPPASSRAEDAQPRAEQPVPLPARRGRVYVQYMPGYPLPPGWVSDSFAIQQQALEAADLTGERPASINSGRHRERVEKSRRLPGIASDIAADRRPRE